MKYSLILLLSFWIFSCGTMLGPKKSNSYGGDVNGTSVKRINLNTGSADVIVEAVEGDIGNIQIIKDERKPRVGEHHCEAYWTQEGTTLTVIQEHDGMGECHAQIHVKAPKSASIDANIGSGQLYVANMNSEKISAKLGSGEIKLDGASGVLDFNVGSGKAEILRHRALNGETSQIKLKVGSGKITLDYAFEPKTGYLTIDTGSGDVLVYMPTATRFSLASEIGSGKLNNEFGYDANAPFEVRTEVGSGDVVFKRK